MIKSLKYLRIRMKSEATTTEEMYLPINFKKNKFLVDKPLLQFVSNVTSSFQCSNEWYTTQEKNKYDIFKKNMNNNCNKY